MALTIQDIGIDMAFNITQNTKDIMNDLKQGNAFNIPSTGTLSAVADDWQNIYTNQENEFGLYSPLYDKLEPLVSNEPLGPIDVANLTDGSGNPLEADEKQALIGKAKGFITSFSGHLGNRVNNLAEDISLYATHQSVSNALGESNNCGGLTDHFGSIIAMGGQVSQLINDAKGAIDTFKAAKAQIQGEINDFDQNAIGILTGKINNTVLSNLVKGSGLYDQLDGIFTASGIAKNSTQAQEIRNEIAGHLTPSLNDFYHKKSAVNEEVEQVTQAREGVLGSIGKELHVWDKAISTLRRLGNANALQSLFKTNECVQTLMGFVGQSGFISKLGI